jgi:hypothetical protein
MGALGAGVRLIVDIPALWVLGPRGREGAMSAFGALGLSVTLALIGITALALTTRWGLRVLYRRVHGGGAHRHLGDSAASAYWCRLSVRLGAGVSQCVWCGWGLGVMVRCGAGVRQSVLGPESACLLGAFGCFGLKAMDSTCGRMGALVVLG